MNCPPCKGSGRKWGTLATMCVLCRGTGTLPDDRISQPDCRSCRGSGRAFATLARSCDICGGWGRLPPTDPQLPSQLSHSLDYFNFAVTKNDLTQAVNNVQRKQWESANGDLRAFLESLCEEIAGHKVAAEGPPPTRGQARQYLVNSGFLTAEQGALLQAFFAVLQPGGGHAGATESDCNCRFSIAVALANFYLSLLSR